MKSSIKGPLYDGIPNIECTFGIEDVNIQLPHTDRNISNLSLSGYFKSGDQRDLSNARLDIEKISAVLPDGNLMGKLSVQNLMQPAFDIDIKLKSDISGFDNVFDLGSIDSLYGGVEIIADFRGYYDKDLEYFVEQEDNSSLEFNNVSFAADVEGENGWNRLLRLLWQRSSP